MEVLGFPLSDGDLVLLGIAGTLIMLLLGVYVPAAINRRHVARDVYSTAFDLVLLNFRENPDCTLAQVAFEVHGKHLAAIDKYRESLPFWKRRGF